jgi:amino acid permease
MTVPRTAILNPPFDSELRKSSLVVATFNLVATIIGGGVLSLPFAFEKCGIIGATVLMVFAATITAMSLNLLCTTARKTGATSYGGVGKDAFGAWLDTGISVLLFVFLLFVLTAYMVLLRDIWTPLVRLLLPTINGDVVLLVIILLMSPCLIQRTLHALRFNCYVGFGSVSILCLALVHHAIMVDQKDLKYFPHSLSDALVAFPIITLSFLSAFNVLPIQNALIRPTQERIQATVDLAVVSCFLLMYCFGLSGYLYAQTETRGNILLNCSEDWMLLLGRIGCGITIMLGLAMMMLPCRDSLLEVVDLVIMPKSRDDALIQECTPLTTHNTPTQPSVKNSSMALYASTFGITLLTYTGAVLAPGVAIVWSICGSSMAFVISFLLPAACYLELDSKIPTTQPTLWKRMFSWFLIVFSFVGAILCTSQTVLTLESRSPEN